MIIVRLVVGLPHEEVEGLGLNEGSIGLLVYELVWRNSPLWHWRKLISLGKKMKITT